MRCPVSLRSVSLSLPPPSFPLYLSPYLFFSLLLPFPLSPSAPRLCLCPPLLREHWLKEAEAAESAQSPLTAAAIVHNVLSIGVEKEDQKRTWIADAESSIARGAPQTAKAIFAEALSVFPAKKSIWLRAAALAKKHGSSQELEEMLRKAVTYCPQVGV